MSVRVEELSCEVLLTPTGRGAPDELRSVLEVFLADADAIDVASQQMSDRGVVNALVGAGNRHRVFVESRYLTEATPLHPEQIWQPGGHREANRECLAALSRAGIEVRADVIGGALQHVNYVVAGRRGAGAVITSANLAPGSIDTHLNWAISTTAPAVVEALTDVFRAIWDGDFRDAAAVVPLAADGDLGVLAVGSNGEAVDEAINRINAAHERIRFAYFAMSHDARVARALLDATARGVDVAGVVDADQGHQHWDAAPQLRDGGVDARYYPGALTGAPGRMHHKTFVVDREATHLATANASHAAEKSFELGITLSSTAVADVVDAEILRLGANARIDPIALR